MPLTINFNDLTPFERKAVRRMNREINRNAETRPTDDDFLLSQINYVLDSYVRELIKEERPTAEEVSIRFLQASGEVRQQVRELLGVTL